MSGEGENPMFDAPASGEETNFPTRRTGGDTTQKSSSVGYGRIPNHQPQIEEKSSRFWKNKKK